MSTYNDYDDQSLEIEGDFLPLEKYSLRAIFTGTPCKKCHSFFLSCWYLYAPPCM